MYKVYVLYSQSADKLYIGFTNSLIKRIESHNIYGKKDWTSRYKPWILIHVEFFKTKADALKREKELKGGQGRQFIRNEILPVFFK